MRHLLLGLLLFATVAAAAWVKQKDEALSQEIVTASRSIRIAAPDRASTDSRADEYLPVLALDKLGRKEPDEDTAIDTDLFEAMSWYVPPPPPVVAPKVQLPPPPPTAPPLPFTYMGEMEDGGRLMVYLAKGERAYSVAAGETIEGTYRIESIDGGQVVFTYLPLSIKQTLKAETQGQ